MPLSVVERSGRAETRRNPVRPTIRSAMELLKRVVDAKGGLAALKKVTTVVADADTVFQMEKGPLPSTTRTYVLYPDKFRVDAKVTGVDAVQVYNSGARRGCGIPPALHEPPAPIRDDFANSVRRDTIPMLIAAAEGRYSVRLLAEEGREGRVLRVLEISGDQLQPVRLFIDPQGQIVRQAFASPAPGGRTVQVEEVFSDYRKVEGVLVPYKAELVHDGRPILTRTLRSVVLNSPVDEKLFVRPEK